MRFERRTITIQLGRMIKKGLRRAGHAIAVSMRFIGVGYLFTRAACAAANRIRCLTAPARVMPALPGLVTRPAVLFCFALSCYFARFAPDELVSAVRSDTLINSELTECASVDSTRIALAVGPVSGFES